MNGVGTGVGTVVLTGGTSPTEGVGDGVGGIVGLGVGVGGVSSSCEGTPPPRGGSGVAVAVAVGVALGVVVGVTFGVAVAVAVLVAVGGGVLLHSRFEVSPPHGWHSVMPHAPTVVNVPATSAPARINAMCFFT